MRWINSFPIVFAKQKEKIFILNHYNAFPELSAEHTSRHASRMFEQSPLSLSMPKSVTQILGKLKGLKDLQH